MTTDALTNDRIAEHLRTARYGRSLEVRASTGSTNDDARGAADAGAPDGHVVVADAQTAGRGRHGHAWDSPPGDDLYFSIVARTPLPLRDLPPLTLAVGLAIAEVAELYARTPVHVKWPNDVWIGERKVAGILVETTTSDDPPVPVIGIGLDVNRRDFGELEEIATSLALHAGADLDRAVVLADALAAIERRVDGLIAAGPAPIVEALNARLALRGEPVCLDDLDGTLVGVAKSGAVRIHTQEGIVERTAGQLTRRLPRRIE